MHPSIVQEISSQVLALRPSDHKKIQVRRAVSNHSVMAAKTGR